MNIEAFRSAIYENLVDALTKVKQFKRSVAERDRNIDSLSDLLTLKTPVEAYTPGSETRRAVHLKRSHEIEGPQSACTRDGKVVLETLVDVVFLEAIFERRTISRGTWPIESSTPARP